MNRFAQDTQFSIVCSAEPIDMQRYLRKWRDRRRTECNERPQSLAESSLRQKMNCESAHLNSCESSYDYPHAPPPRRPRCFGQVRHSTRQTAAVRKIQSLPEEDSATLRRQVRKKNEPAAARIRSRHEKSRLTAVVIGSVNCLLSGVSEKDAGFCKKAARTERSIWQRLAASSYRARCQWSEAEPCYIACTWSRNRPPA